MLWHSPGKNLLNFYLNFNGKQKEIGLGQPRPESDSFLLKFQLKSLTNALAQPRPESIEFLFKLQLKTKGIDRDLGQISI